MKTALWTAALCLANGCVQAAPLEGSQVPLREAPSLHDSKATKKRELKGKFLHITDLHPDPYYKLHSSVSEEDACHRGKGAAGVYGAELTSCDSPLHLINATFDWIAANLRDEIDFVVWTGDSARHDNDEDYPRTEKQILKLNRFAVQKFHDIFTRGEDDDGDPTNDLVIPIVPTFGNNDILPHNIFLKGPNTWTRNYLDVWKEYIPEAQRHTFEQGGYFYVEVIPNELAVFSLNSLYFFENNVGVDGCENRHEPGYQQFEWLRIQLEFMRKRGMKAILTGHVPPARTESKQSWDETCWQKYTLWTQRYRDILVGSLWGHMNVDYFMFQDSKDITIEGGVKLAEDDGQRVALDEEFTIQSASDYLADLRDAWSTLPDPPKELGKWTEADVLTATKGGKKKKKAKKVKKFLDEVGGQWAERYAVSFNSPSIVPNYFPSLRVFEYNTTGLDITNVFEGSSIPPHDEEAYDHDEFTSTDNYSGEAKQVHSSKKPKLPKKPSKSAPPGPAYSPQTLTWLGYTQFFANITVLNNDFVGDKSAEDIGSSGWKDGKHPNKKPSSKPKPKPFTFELEYNTQNDSVYKLEDLTVKSMYKLANRIGRYEADVKKHKKKGKKGKKKAKKAEKLWRTFITRAFVGAKTEEDLMDIMAQRD